MLLSHRKDEWRNSAVAPQIIELNVYSIKNNAVSERFLANINIPKVHKDAAWRYIRKHYKFLVKATEIRVWLVDDVGSLGCYKPDKPRIDQQGKVVKDEHPRQTEITLFLLNPGSLWTDIALLSGVSRQGDDFWQWVEDNPSVLIVLTEGAKKAGSLLSIWSAVIALPGVTMGLRTPKNDKGLISGKSFLIPELDKFAVPGRTFYFAFDQETKQKNTKNVNKALLKTGELLSQKGCTAKVIEWHPGKGKEVDDLIVQNGGSEFYRAYDVALTLDNWNAKSFSRLTYPANITINQRYLQNLFVPEQAKLTCRKSPKGTRKTQGLKIYVEEAIRQSLATLVIGCAFGYPIFSIKLGRNGRSGCGVWGVGTLPAPQPDELEAPLEGSGKSGVGSQFLFPDSRFPIGAAGRSAASIPDSRSVGRLFRVGLEEPYSTCLSPTPHTLPPTPARERTSRSGIPYTRPPTPCTLDESWEIGFAN